MSRALVVATGVALLSSAGLARPLPVAGLAEAPVYGRAAELRQWRLDTGNDIYDETIDLDDEDVDEMMDFDDEDFDDEDFDDEDFDDEDFDDEMIDFDDGAGRARRGQVCGGNDGNKPCDDNFASNGDPVYNGDLQGRSAGRNSKLYVSNSGTTKDVDFRCQDACSRDQRCEFWVRSTNPNSKGEVACWKKKQFSRFSRTNSKRRGRQIRTNSRTCRAWGEPLKTKAEAKLYCCTAKYIMSANCPGCSGSFLQIYCS